MILALLNRGPYHFFYSRKAKMWYSIFVVYLLDCSHPVQVHKIDHKHSVIEFI